MSYKMQWIFIRTKKGEGIGRIMSYSTLRNAVEGRQLYRKQGYNCSKIAKKKK